MNVEQQVSEQDAAGDNGPIVHKTKLIINYIPQLTSEQELATIFSQVGIIENIRIMRDHCTGYSYGFGFVKYRNPEHAARAIAMFNGLNIRNKRLKVSYSRPPSQDMKDSNLYITNLPKDVTENEMDRVFGAFGEIIQRTVLKDKVSGMPRGVGFVRFSKSEEAQAAISALNGKRLKNSVLPLSIRVAEDHGKYRARYLLRNNYVCPFSNEGFGRTDLMPTFREIHPTQPNFMVRGRSHTQFQNFHMQRYMALGAGDNLFQNGVFW